MKTISSSIALRRNLSHDITDPLGIVFASEKTEGPLRTSAWSSIANGSGKTGSLAYYCLPSVRSLFLSDRRKTERNHEKHQVCCESEPWCSCPSIRAAR